MIIYNILGKLYEILFKSYVKTSVSSLKKRLAGGRSCIAWPYVIKGAENFVFSDNVSITALSFRNACFFQFFLH